jgi:hypothetical protein
MDHVDWLEQDDIDVLCAALKDQVKVRMDRKYVFYWKLGKLFNVMYENLKLEAF